MHTLDLRSSALDGDRLSIWLIGAATLLAVVEIALGTSLLFALGVYATLVVTILALRALGFSSVGGLLLAYLSFRYLGFSQVAKCLLGQPADTNLAAPLTTIAVLLVGMASICAAAMVVAHLFRGRAPLAFQPTTAQLTTLRNFCFLFGTACVGIAFRSSRAETGDPAFGGVAALGWEMAGIRYLAILAETWRVLTLSGGQKSVSPGVILLVGFNAVIGLALGSKQGVADPFLFYFLASFAFRRTISRSQIAFVGVLLLVGVLVLYPLINVTRQQISPGGDSLSETLGAVDRLLERPQGLMGEWQDLSGGPPSEQDLHTQGLYYLGVFDALLSRFALIANTDVIVDSVEQDGPYGLDLVTDGVKMIVPSFLAPDKPRVRTCDLITWFYGLRPTGIVGNPTIGLFADSYAAMEWWGIAVIPFVTTLAFLGLIQLTGTSTYGNVIGTYFLAQNFHTFGENGIEEFIDLIGRLIPLHILVLFIFIYLARMISARPASANVGVRKAG